MRRDPQKTRFRTKSTDLAAERDELAPGEPVAVAQRLLVIETVHNGEPVWPVRDVVSPTLRYVPHEVRPVKLVVNGNATNKRQHTTRNAVAPERKTSSGRGVRRPPLPRDEPAEQRHVDVSPARGEPGAASVSRVSHARAFLVLRKDTIRAFARGKSVKVGGRIQSRKEVVADGDDVARRPDVAHSRGGDE